MTANLDDDMRHRLSTLAVPASTRTPSRESSYSLAPCNRTKVAPQFRVQPGCFSPICS
ncbi:hypothetical protein BDZ89DRAFT_1060388 [Hymenopellis radicata]|nr:hypothetical protein BDZ89DRAFT_1060388 [Hymenopellis radicata]